MVESDLDSVITPRVRKVLEAAEEHGWSENPYVSVVVRLAKPGDDLAKPFFMKWVLTRAPDGKRSWRFDSARANNGQPLNYRDCLVYLADPSVIYPEPPSGEENGK
jgi:hypothetical protein